MKEYQFEYAPLGTIYIIENPRSIKLVARIKGAAIHITVPCGTPRRVIVDMLDKYCDDFAAHLKEHPLSRVNFDFAIDTPFLHLTILPKEGDKFYAQRKGREVSVLCPPQTDFENPDRQEWLHRVIEKQMQEQAKNVFPPHLYMLAQKHGFVYRTLRIQNSHTRWGSCSRAKGINLSLYLLLLPEHLIDYVMLHELCHTVEMNHSDRFWTLLDTATDGRSMELRNELRKYRTDF